MNETSDTTIQKNSKKFEFKKITLSFYDNDLELEYEDRYFEQSLYFVRRVLLLSLLLYCGFAIFDHFMAPQIKYIFYFLRFAILAPSVILVYILSYTPFFNKNFQLTIFLLVLLSGFMISLMCFMVSDETDQTYYVGLILVFMFIFTISRLRFVWASLSAFIILASYEFVVYSSPEIDLLTFLNNNFFLIGTLFLGMIAAYVMEYTSRKNFILVKLLENEYVKTSELNLMLEDKVEERTKKLSKTLSEKDLLLKEVFHRVKNNLQIITSMLRMQVRFTDNNIVKSKLQRSLDRIYSMSLIQSKLFQSNDFESVYLPSYISSIVTNLISSLNLKPGNIKIKYNIPDIKMDINIATPFGLLVSEIVSNAFEHAFPNDVKGIINISIEFSDEIYKLSISDNGVGIDEQLDTKSTRSIGFLLIQSLVSQLKGELQINTKIGTEILITFKESKLKTYSKIR